MNYGLAIPSHYVYQGDFGCWRVPGEIVMAALDGKFRLPKKLDGRTRFAKAINAWGRWMDYCEQVKAS